MLFVVIFPIRSHPCNLSCRSRLAKRDPWLNASLGSAQTPSGEGIEEKRAEGGGQDHDQDQDQDHDYMDGAGDGTRTRNLLITNQLLYQLSYAGLVPPRGLEPRTN